MLLYDDLFPQILPAGLTYLPRYVSRTQEQQLPGRIEQGAWDRAYARRCKHYGASYHSAGQHLPGGGPEMVVNAIPTNENVKTVTGVVIR